MALPPHRYAFVAVAFAIQPALILIFSASFLLLLLNKVDTTIQHSLNIFHPIFASSFSFSSFSFVRCVPFLLPSHFLLLFFIEVKKQIQEHEGKNASEIAKCFPFQLRIRDENHCKKPHLFHHLVISRSVAKNEWK